MGSLGRGDLVPSEIGTYDTSVTYGSGDPSDKTSQIDEGSTAADVDDTDGIRWSGVNTGKASFLLDMPTTYDLELGGPVVVGTRYRTEAGFPDTRAMTLFLRIDGTDYDIHSWTATNHNDFRDIVVTMHNPPAAYGDSWSSISTTNVPLIEVGINCTEMANFNIDFSNLYVIATLTQQVPGEGRWRRGPEQREIVVVCAICGIPYHWSDIVEVKDPNHPHFGYYVCYDDYDDYYIEGKDPRGPALIEGDLDPTT